MKEKLSNGETSEEQSHGNVAWKGDVYSQVLGNEKSDYVCGLGLGPTPALLWGSKSFLQNVVDDDKNRMKKCLRKKNLHNSYLLIFTTIKYTFVAASTWQEDQWFSIVQTITWFSKSEKYQNIGEKVFDQNIFE